MSKILGADCNPNSEYFFANENIGKLARLIVSRNAYWELLNWKPDWTKDWLDEGEGKNLKYIICVVKDKIKLDTTYDKNTIFAFPTRLSRNVFYETFKNDLEEIKNLL
jgi:hypothetical protein